MALVARSDKKSQAKKTQPRRRWWPGSWKTPKLGSSTAMVVVMIALAGNSGPVQQLSRLMACTASVAESTTFAATSLIDGSLNASQVLTQTVIASAQNSLNLVQEVWSGIELADLIVHSRSGRFRSSSGATLASWLRKSGAASLRISEDCADLMAATADAVCYRMPALAQRDEFLNMSGTFVSCEVDLQMLASGYFEATWRWRAVSFASRWSNPLWDFLDMNADSERDQVIHRLSVTLANSRNITPDDTGWAHIEADGAPQRFWDLLCLWARCFWSTGRFILSLVLSLFWPF